MEEKRVKNHIQMISPSLEGFRSHVDVALGSAGVTI